MPAALPAVEPKALLMSNVEHFLESITPVNPQYLSKKGESSAREVIQLGARKLIGSGQHTEIWKDLWIPNLPNFKTLPRAQVDEEAPRKVCELINEGTWDMERLNDHFVEWEIKEIMNIHVAQYSYDDLWVWHHTKNGEFSVRSAYHAQLKSKRSTGASSSTPLCNAVWKNLWSANAPQKIKIFGWRATHNGVPMRHSLAKRGICSDVLCQLCGEAPETLMHALFLCPSASAIWYASPLKLVMDRGKLLSFRDFCCSLMSEFKIKDWWNIRWCILWGIWLKRNALVFEQKCFKIEDLIRKALSLLGEFERANVNLSSSLIQIPSASHCWSPSVFGCVKINTLWRVSRRDPRALEELFGTRFGMFWLQQY